MPRRTKEQLRIDRNEKRISELIIRVKWLRDQKYYKTNYWSVAHWESWARQGKDGSCGCGVGHYNASLCNKRRRTKKRGGVEWCGHVVEKLCHECMKLSEQKIGVEFKRDYAHYTYNHQRPQADGECASDKKPID